MADGRLEFFDLMSVINNKTKIEWNQDSEVAYNPFMINRGFSNFSDAVLYANEMNKYSLLDKKLQFDFYYHYLPKGKRFGKWEKALKQSKDEDRIIEYFSVSRDKTKSYIDVLNASGQDWRKEIDEVLDKGGRKR